MQIELESSLDRWTQAALLKPEQAARIREYETTRAPRRGARVPILIGLALGGIMLAAGVALGLLFLPGSFGALLPYALLVGVLMHHLGESGPEWMAVVDTIATVENGMRLCAPGLEFVDALANGSAVFVVGDVVRCEIDSTWPALG